ncbi:phage tail assembly chaperone [Paraburkholderia sp. BR10936]|uniref:XkdW family protein n=1 Tax=Paraburkholderia sp. BR10936 TaxID=3236993 RepID=UPI0034D21FAB
MDNPDVSGPFSHDLMVTVLADLYPALKPSVDYVTAHPLDERGKHAGDPFIIYWRPTDPPQPKDADIKAKFQADEARYRGVWVRRYRDMCLAWSDSKVIAPPDAPPTLTRALDGWKAYRQALRDVPQQPGFPFEIDWPQAPEG